MSDDHVSVEFNGVKIMKVVTSQSETIQAKQFEANNYFTSMEIAFDGGLDITDRNNINKVIQSAALANALCTANNRRNEWRDGLAPRVGTSAAGYLEAQAGNIDGNTMYRPENIIDPKAMGKLTMDLVKKVKEALVGVQVSEKMAVDSKQVEEQTTAATTKTIESTPAPASAPKRRVNPARSASPATNQEVVS